MNPRPQAQDEIAERQLRERSVSDSRIADIKASWDAWVACQREKLEQLYDAQKKEDL